MSVGNRNPIKENLDEMVTVHVSERRRKEGMKLMAEMLHKGIEAGVIKSLNVKKEAVNNG